ncbi:TetR/AcrR family transcriptional regulator [Mycobacterium sp. LTG2003]
MGGARRYGGATGEERIAERRNRFLDAGLQLMGTRGIAATTLRGVSDAAGLAPRYLAESFPTIEDLHIAVFERIADEIETACLAAIAQAADNPPARTRAALAALTDLLLGDPRKGQVMLIESASSPAVGPRRRAGAQRFAAILADLARGESPGDGDVLQERLAAHFIIGGVSEALAAVLASEIDIDRGHLIDRLTALLFGATLGSRSPQRLG